MLKKGLEYLRRVSQRARRHKGKRNDAVTGADESVHGRNFERLLRFAEVSGLWVAAAVAVAAVIIASRDSNKQYNAMISQQTVMQDQLRQMKFDARPWIGLENVVEDVEIVSSKAFKIVAVIKNHGRSPAPRVKACVGSDTPNIRERDKVGIKKMLDQISQCREPKEAVLMPNGQFGFDVSRPAVMMSASVVDDIKAEFATFSVFGRIDYEDSDGSKFWTTFCALRVSAGRYDACIYGNEAR